MSVPLAAGPVAVTLSIVNPIFSQTRTISLLSGKTSEFDVSFTLPAKFSPGGYKLIARINPANQAFFDKDELNNTATKPLKIT